MVFTESTELVLVGSPRATLGSSTGSSEETSMSSVPTWARRWDRAPGPPGDRSPRSSISGVSTGSVAVPPFDQGIDHGQRFIDHQLMGDHHQAGTCHTACSSRLMPQPAENPRRSVSGFEPRPHVRRSRWGRSCSAPRTPRGTGAVRAWFGSELPVGNTGRPGLQGTFNCEIRRNYRCPVSPRDVPWRRGARCLSSS